MPKKEKLEELIEETAPSFQRGSVVKSPRFMFHIGASKEKIAAKMEEAKNCVRKVLEEAKVSINESEFKIKKEPADKTNKGRVIYFVEYQS